MNRTPVGRSIRNHAGQFRLFMPEQLSKQIVDVTKIDANGRLVTTAPLVEMEKATVSRLRNLLIDKAQLYYYNMKKELNNPLVKQYGLHFQLQMWPNGENWTWPSENMHLHIQKRIKSIVLQPYETKKAACLKWANYDRWVIMKLGRLDELLRTGNLDEFFNRCHTAEGVFRLEKKKPKEDANRSILKPHWPNRTHEFLALEKEWKKENGQMNKKENWQM